MLVLTRNIKQKIIIGKDIVITVLNNRNNQVKIGIDAPKEVPVMREELCQKQPSKPIYKITR